MNRNMNGPLELGPAIERRLRGFEVRLGETLRHEALGLVHVIAVGPDWRLKEREAEVLVGGRVHVVAFADLHHGRKVWVDDD